LLQERRIRANNKEHKNFFMQDGFELKKN